MDDLAVSDRNGLHLPWIGDLAVSDRNGLHPPWIGFSKSNWL
jgi:hypothetical protein